MTQPSVTAICITRNRRQWLPAAIECFQSQAYENCSLLVVADGDPVESLIPGDDRRVRLVCCEQMNVGDKRNFACSLADSDLICHWDDDDWSAPGRIADQVQRMQDAGKSVTGYRTMRFTDGERSWAYTGEPKFALGTSLCYRRDWWAAHRFPGVQIGEDNAFVATAARAGQLAAAEAGDLMYARIHPGNTSRKVIGGNWRPVQ